MAISVQKNEVDLSKYFLQFGEKTEEFYQECFGDITNREASIALGYKIRTKKSTRQSTAIKRAKRIRASRFVLMCNNLKKNPKSIIKKYKPKIVCFSVPRGGSRLVDVDEKIINNIYRAICDGK